MALQTAAEHKLRRIEITARASEAFPVPVSDGYSVYSSLLGVLDDVDAAVSAHIHDSPLGSLHCSGLRGVFGDSERAHHKVVRPDEPYRLTLGVIDPKDRDIFQALVRGVVLEGVSIELSHGSLTIEEFESENTTHSELLTRAGELNDPTMDLEFRTATCIVEAGDVTTAFPHRWSVFNSLLGKWNRSCPDDLELDFDRETLLGSVYAQPEVQTLDTHSVLVNRVTNEDGETRNLFRQGFTGRVRYAFKDPSESVENAVTALGLFGEYSGVGSAVSRGCGNVEVEVEVVE